MRKLRPDCRSPVLLAVAALALSAVLCPAAAAVSIGIYEDPTGFDCHAPGSTTVESRTYYVVVRQRDGGVAGVGFAAPLPGCLGAAFVADTSPFGAKIGDSQAGVTITFGGCVTSEAILVLSIEVMQFPGDGTTCCAYPVLPQPGSLQPYTTYVSCDFVEYEAQARTAWLNDDGTCEIQPPPSNPSPPSGATGVALPVALDWDTPLPHWCNEPLYSLLHTVYFGTTPDPPMVGQHIDPPHDPGPLVPNTTYYWRVHASTGLSAAMGPLWSFTTSAGVPAHQSTWGAIKALFR